MIYPSMPPARLIFLPTLPGSSLLFLAMWLTSRTRQANCIYMSNYEAEHTSADMVAAFGPLLEEAKARSAHTPRFSLKQSLVLPGTSPAYVAHVVPWWSVTISNTLQSYTAALYD